MTIDHWHVKSTFIPACTTTPLSNENIHYDYILFESNADI